MRVIFAFEAKVLRVLDLVRLGATIVIVRVMESDLATMSVLAH